VSHAKTAEWIKMLFGSRIAWDQRTITKWVHTVAIWQIQLNNLRSLVMQAVTTITVSSICYYLLLLVTDIISWFWCCRDGI